MRLLFEIAVNGITQASYLALMGIGLSLIFGILRVVNFSHGSLFMLGAYCSYYVVKTLGADYYLLSLPAAALMIAALGYVLEVSLFSRLKGQFLQGAVISIGIGLLIEGVAVIVFPGAPVGVQTPFSHVWSLGGVVVEQHRLIVLVVAVGALAAVNQFVGHTRMGRAMRAVQQDPAAAALQGIHPERISTLAFVLGAGLAGFAGALVAPLQLLLPTMGTAPLLLAFVIIIMGGMGSVAGALVSAVIVGVLQSAVTTLWSPTASLGAIFLCAMAVLLLRPTGLFGRA